MNWKYVVAKGNPGILPVKISELIFPISPIPGGPTVTPDWR